MFSLLILLDSYITCVRKNIKLLFSNKSTTTYLLYYATPRFGPFSNLKLDTLAEIDKILQSCDIFVLCIWVVMPNFTHVVTLQIIRLSNHSPSPAHAHKLWQRLFAHDKNTALCDYITTTLCHLPEKNTTMWAHIPIVYYINKPS